MLIQPHPLLTRQQSNTAIEDIVPGKVDEGSTHFIPGDEQEVDAAPDGSLQARAWEGGGAVPFRAGGPGRRGQCGLEKVLAEELGDDGVEEEGTDVVDWRVGFGDDEVDVAGVGGAAAVGAADDDVNVFVDVVQGGANGGAVDFDFGAGDAGQEVGVMSDADFLVGAEVRVGEEVG